MTFAQKYYTLELAYKYNVITEKCTVQTDMGYATVEDNGLTNQRFLTPTNSDFHRTE